MKTPLSNLNVAKDHIEDLESIFSTENNESEGIHSFSDRGASIRKLSTFIIFMILGSGANWVLSNALAQEIPYFEISMPQRLCTATYMNAATNLSLVLVLLVVLHNYIYGPIPHRFAVPSLLSLGAFGAFLTAFTYPVIYYNNPIFLLLSCAIGGTVGALSAILMTPFLTFYENDMISAARCGGSGGTLLTAIVGFVQKPGSSNQRFSPSVFFFIFGFFLCLPLLAYIYVIRNGIGLKDSLRSPTSVATMAISTDFNSYCRTDHVYTITMKSEEEEKSSNVKCFDDDGNVELLESSSHRSTSQHVKNFHSSHLPDPLSHSSSSTKNSTSAALITKADNIIASNLRIENGFLDSSDSPQSGHSTENTWSFSCLVSKRHCLCNAMDRIPWLTGTLPYMLAVGWIDFNTWGMLSALMPFAMANVSTDGGAERLATAYEVGAVCLIAGDFSTTLCRLPYAPCLILFSGCAFYVYACAGGLIHDRHPLHGQLLIAMFSLGRFLEAHMLTTAYRAVASELSPEHREAGAMAVGLTDQLMTTMGTLVSTLLVSQLVKC